MNIFYLTHNPMQCAEQHCDKHVVKMILESAQMLSSAKRRLDGIEYYAKTKTIIYLIALPLSDIIGKKEIIDYIVYPHSKIQ